MTITAHTGRPEPEAPGLTKTPPGNAPLWAMTPEGTVLPSELPPASPVTSGRFRRRIDEISSADDDGLSQPGAEVRELIERYAPPGAERADIVEQALLIESAHAELSDLVAALKRGVDRLPTTRGDLMVLHTRILATAVAPDVSNVRAEANGAVWHRDGAVHLVPPVLAEEDSTSGERQLRFRDTEHFTKLNENQREALGFNTANVRNDRNRYDLEHIARQGVLKSILVGPTRLVDEETGDSGLVLMTENGARRTTIDQWILGKVLPGIPVTELPIRHLVGDTGTVTFRVLTPEDCDVTRDLLTSAIRPFAGPGPSGTPSEDEVRLTTWSRGLDPAHQAAIRALTMPAMVIVGVDRSSVIAGIEEPVVECLDAYTATLHVPEQSDLEWGEKPIQLSVARSILRRASDVFTHLGPWARGLIFDPDGYGWAAGGLASTSDPDIAAAVPGADPTMFPTDVEGNPTFVPMTLVPGHAPAVASETKRTVNKLDVMLAAAGAMVCRGTDFSWVVSEEIAAKGLPNSPKQRGQLMASACLGLVGMPLVGTASARVHAAVSRTPSHSVVYKLDESADPLGEDLCWINLIGWDWLEISERADLEAAAIARTPGASNDTVGPAQVILALAAAFAMIVSPEVVGTDHQLTLSGLGRRHGPLSAEPFTVLLPLVREEIGRRQLLEIIVALCNDEMPYVPRSVKFDAGSADRHHYGPLLTEYDLRGRTWNPDDDGDTGAESIGAAEHNERLFAEAARHLARFARQCGEVADPDRRSVIDGELSQDADEYGGSVAEAFYGDGIDLDVATDLQTALAALTDVVATGKAIRTMAMARRAGA